MVTPTFLGAQIKKCVTFSTASKYKEMISRVQ